MSVVKGQISNALQLLLGDEYVQLQQHIAAYHEHSGLYLCQSRLSCGHNNGLSLFAARMLDCTQKIYELTMNSVN